MAVSDNRKYTSEFVYEILEGIKGKTLREIDKSCQFDRTIKSEKITGIAGDIVEQSVFGYSRDNNQECDIEIDGKLTELKVTGVRIPKRELKKTKGKSGAAYNVFLGAKEGLTITGVTFEPTIQLDFFTSHFWKKSQRILIVFYEYKSYDVIPASAYADFPIVDYCYNTFSDNERTMLQSDWEIVRDHLKAIYEQYPDFTNRYKYLEGFTHVLRPNLLLIELVPGFKKKSSGSYQKPRYRLKQTFVDYIVRGHFNKSRATTEIKLKEPFSSFAQLDTRCHTLSIRYAGKTLSELKKILNIDTDISTKNFTSKCITKMFDAECDRLNQISDFTKAGIIAKTISITPKGERTEDMKLKHITFKEWTDRDIDFEDSDIYAYFCEHSFLCPIFCERGDMKPQKKNESKNEYHARLSRECGLTTFEGFKRFAFDDDFIKNEVERTWSDSRYLIHNNNLKWEYKYESNGNIRTNANGASVGAPNFPKSSSNIIFFRGGAGISSERTRTECVNGIKMLPQYLWIKGSFIAHKLQEISYI